MQIHSKYGNAEKEMTVDLYISMNYSQLKNKQV